LIGVDTVIIVREDIVSSISQENVQLGRAAQLSKRIVAGQVLEKSSFRFPGSSEYPASAEGRVLHYFRIRVEKTLKGPGSPTGEELRVFCSMEWSHHTHAQALKDGVISYADIRLVDGIPDDQIHTGMNILFFLNEESAPSGFPRGAVFMSFGGAHVQADREKDVVKALREGPHVDFGHFIYLAGKDRVHFPDHLEICFLGHSHKRSRVGGPGKEWIELDLSKDGKNASISLAHHTNVDLSETWEAKDWGAYTIEVKDMTTDDCTILVRKGAPH
jgi:hypothetical protein